MDKLKKYQDFLNFTEEMIDESELSQPELFTDLFEVYEGDFKGYQRVKFRCGLDTPKVLFRLFFLFNELSELIGKAIQDDFYNTSLFRLSANDKNILIDLYIFKYEIHIGYYVKKEFIIDGEVGCYTENEEKKLRDKILMADDNFVVGAFATDEINNYIDAIDKGFVNTSYVIYDGNNFVV